MTRGRLEAFSDGVLAILITIMVLELHVPEEATLQALAPLWKTFFAYALSFLYLAIYWNNHHHLLHAVQRVNGAILWANIHLLFWLSLIPFFTNWIGDTRFAPIPVALYAGCKLMSGFAYYILTRVIVRAEGKGSALDRSLGKDWKGKASVGLYLLAVGVSFVSSYVAVGICFFVAMMWLVPDRRIERVLGGGEK